jgi:hypothetical protein
LTVVPAICIVIYPVTNAGAVIAPAVAVAAVLPEAKLIVPAEVIAVRTVGVEFLHC